jgi:hypothetical protein
VRRAVVKNEDEPVDFTELYRLLKVCVSNEKYPAGEKEKVRKQMAELESRYPELAEKK